MSLNGLQQIFKPSGVTRVKGQPGQLTNKRGRHMGEDELTASRFLMENSYIYLSVYL